MSTQARMLRIVALVAAPLVVGVAAGLTMSKCLWGYFVSPPTVTISPSCHPAAAAMFRAQPAVELLSRQERDEMLQSQFERCRHGDECTYGRTLLATGGKVWLDTRLEDEGTVRQVVADARNTPPAPFFVPTQRGVGAVATYSCPGGSVSLLLFHTYELHDDTHGYFEALFQKADSEYLSKAVAHYYFDVAGIESATPAVLSVIGMVLAYIVGALVFAVFAVVKRLGRQH